MNRFQINEPVISESIEYIPLEIELKIQIDSSYFQAEVVKAVYKILSNTIDHCADKGFFHLDNLTLGQPIYKSKIRSMVQSIAGITSVEVILFKRLGIRTKPSIDIEYIQMADNEIARLDNDPNNPQNGILKIIASGGK